MEKSEQFRTRVKLVEDKGLSAALLLSLFFRLFARPQVRVDS